LGAGLVSGADRAEAGCAGSGCPLAELETAGGVPAAPGGALGDRGRISDQFDDNNVEQVEHVVLRARLQRAEERDQRCFPPLRWQSCHGLRFGDRATTPRLDLLFFVVIIEHIIGRAGDIKKADQPSLHARDGMIEQHVAARHMRRQLNHRG